MTTPSTETEPVTLFTILDVLSNIKELKEGELKEGQYLQMCDLLQEAYALMPKKDLQVIVPIGLCIRYEIGECTDVVIDIKEVTLKSDPPETPVNNRVPLRPRYLCNSITVVIDDTEKIVPMGKYHPWMLLLKYLKNMFDQGKTLVISSSHHPVGFDYGFFAKNAYTIEEIQYDLNDCEIGNYYHSDFTEHVAQNICEYLKWFIDVYKVRAELD